MGKRGPAPGSGGRPKKALADKVLEGNPGKRTLKVIELPAFERADMPEPKAYLSEQQKSGVDLQAAEIFRKTWEWLKERKCESLVSAELIEHYAISSARLIQCEQCISAFGFLAKHPTTGAAIPSPYVQMAQNYMKQTNHIWATIFQIVRENCSADYRGSNPQDDVMERLLTARKR